MHLISAILLSGLLLCCARAQPDQHGTFSISGKVLKSSDQSGVGCSIYLKAKLFDKFHKRTKTDSVGQYRIDRIPPGAYQLTVRQSASKLILDTTLEITSSLTVNAIKWISCKFNAQRAQDDILTGQPRLLLIAGFDPWNKTAVDHEFEKAYGVRYLAFGCMIPDDLSCLRLYNLAIFSWLDSLYGDKWRSSVYPGVIGGINY